MSCIVAGQIVLLSPSLSQTVSVYSHKTWKHPKCGTTEKNVSERPNKGTVKNKLQSRKVNGASTCRFIFFTV